LCARSKQPRVSSLRVSFLALPRLPAPQPTPPPPRPAVHRQNLPRSCVCAFVAARVYAHAVCHSMLIYVPMCVCVCVLMCACARAEILSWSSHLHTAVYVIVLPHNTHLYESTYKEAPWHIFIHRHTYTDVHARTRRHVYNRTHTYTHVHARHSAHTYIHMRKHAHTRRLIHKRASKHTQTHAHTHTHTNIRGQAGSRVPEVSFGDTFVKVILNKCFFLPSQILGWSSYLHTAAQHPGIDGRRLARSCQARFCSIGQ
jgi:hypothetical protein